MTIGVFEFWKKTFDFKTTIFWKKCWTFGV